MVLKLFLLASTFLFISCADFQRDNPTDPNSINYVPPIEPSSSSAVVVPLSSSSVVIPIPSSSSFAPIVVSSSSSVPTPTGIVYGPSVPYEGETYQTVVIGTQTWMARNLNYDVSGSKCYSNNESNCATYGRLYDWATAMNLPSSCNSSTCASQVGTKHKGICPSGWHIPSDGEWITLTNFVGSSTAGKKLKATSGWNSDGNGTDNYGFSALPGGYGGSDGSFSLVGYNGLWWTTSEIYSDYAYRRSMGYIREGANEGYYGKGDLLSVRCLQD